MDRNAVKSLSYGYGYGVPRSAKQRLEGENDSLHRGLKQLETKTNALEEDIGE